jgi:hypothetical protein
MQKDLENLLEDVWSRSSGGTRALTFSEIYRGYEAPSQNIEFVEGLHPAKVAVDLGGFRDAESAAQHDQIPSEEIIGVTPLGSEVPGHDIGVYDEDDPLSIAGTNTGLGYLWFSSPYYVANAATERVVIHANPYNRAIRLMKLIRREILQENPLFAGVNSAKVATLPCFRSGRNDVIIIYTTDNSATKAVLHRLRRWIAGGDVSSRDFMDALPFLIKVEEVGIGWASEPPNGIQVLAIYPAKLSFGKYLSQVVQIGLGIFVDQNTRSKQIFLELLADVLVQAGFDLAQPQRISTPTPLFQQSVPWPAGEERKKKPLYLRMAKDHGLIPLSSH